MDRRDQAVRFPGVRIPWWKWSVLVFDKPPTSVPQGGSPDTWVFIGLLVLLAFAIILGIVTASKKGKRGGYWSEKDR
jgi:hypothetical protein